jgi:hypothetical protein
VRLANSIEAFRMLLTTTQAACSSQWDTRRKCFNHILIVKIAERFLATLSMCQCIFTLPLESCT